MDFDFLDVSVQVTTVGELISRAVNQPTEIWSKMEGAYVKWDIRRPTMSRDFILTLVRVLPHQVI